MEAIVFTFFTMAGFSAVAWFAYRGIQADIDARIRHARRVDRERAARRRREIAAVRGELDLVRAQVRDMRTGVIEKPGAPQFGSFDRLEDRYAAEWDTVVEVNSEVVTPGRTR